MSDPFLTAVETSSLPLERLRAVLRLVLPPDRADRAADRIDRAPDQVAALNDLATALNRDRLLSRISRRLGQSMIPTGLSPVAAVALLGHVGLGIDGERLEDGIGVDERRLGEYLHVARAQYGGRPDLACREMAWLVGRYRDGRLPTDDRLLLLSHLQGCEGCRQALESAQAADTTLLEAVERELAALLEWSPEFRKMTPVDRVGPVAIGGSVLVVVLGLLAVASFLGGLFAPDKEPVPLFAGEYRAPVRHEGWLIQVSPVGFLEAIDLSTGFKRGLDSGDASGGFVPSYRVSRTHIATWRPSDGQRDDSLTVGPIGEQIKHRMTWNRQFVFWYPSGWLDDDTLLIVKSPEHIPGESEQAYLERQTRDSRLVAFDAVTGEERVLMTGDIAAAYPSPDGTMLAIQNAFDRRWPGVSIELRPTDGVTVGDPVVRIERRMVGDGLWLADSSAYVAPIIVDEAIRMDASRQSRNLSEHGVERVALERIAADGRRSTLTAIDVPDAIAPLSSSPDGRTIVYQIRSDHAENQSMLVPAYDWQCFAMDLAGGASKLLASGGTPERVYRPAWSPDGRSLALPIARAFPLSTDGQIDQPVSPNATTLLIFGPDPQLNADPVAFYSAGRDLHGWLPPDAFDAHPGETASGGRSLASVAPEGGAFEDLAIDGPVSDDNGSYVLVEDRRTSLPFAWSVDAQRPRRLIDRTTEHSWFNNGTATISVASDQDGEPGSRIVLTVAEITRSPAYLDHRYFDPAALGASREHRYGLPLVAPGGRIVSFFVIDEQQDQLTLWVDDDLGPATIVGTWRLPDDAVPDIRLVAAWASADTLLFAIPEGWRDGWPTASALSRLVVAADGTHRVDPLVRLDGLGRSRGVELVELAVSPDGSQIAYRLRHSSSDGETDDTIHVASAEDLSRAIEIDRGGRGDGLHWTDDGGSLIAGIRGRVARYAPDGRSRDFLSPRGVRVDHAVLVDGQLWFNGDDDRGTRIWTIELK